MTNPLWRKIILKNCLINENEYLGIFGNFDFECKIKIQNLGFNIVERNKILFRYIGSAI